MLSIKKYPKSKKKMPRKHLFLHGVELRRGIAYSNMSSALKVAAPFGYG